MYLELNVNLDKIKINIENKKEAVQKIRNDLSNIVSQSFTIYDLSDKRDDLYGYTLGLESFFYCGDEESSLGLKLIFNGSESKEVFETIYNTFHYLETLTNSKKNWSIETEYSVFVKEDNKKFHTIINKEKLIWNYTNYGDIDVLEILRYIATERSDSSFIRNYYLELEKEIEYKEKYKNVLQNAKNYEKKIIPFELKNIKKAKYNDIEIVLSLDYDSVEDLLDSFKRYKKKETVIVKKENIPYNYINTDFSKTTLIKYTIIDQDDNLFYILTETNGLVDEVDSVLYLFTGEIDNRDLQQIVCLFDKN